MAFFGEYLISKGHITSDVLVDALIEQSQGSPTAAEIARKSNIFTASEILKIFSIQTQKETDFKSAALELSLWTPEVNEKINAEISRIRIPIGQILTKRKAISFETLTKALDEFLGTIKAEASPPPVQAILEPPKAVETSMPSSAFSFHTIDPALATEYCDFVDPAQLQSIVNQLVALPAESFLDPAAVIQLKEILQHLHRVKGMARCIRAAITESLISGIEKVILGLLKNPQGFTVEKIRMFKDQSLIAVDVILQIRDCIRAKNSEESAMVDPVLKQTIPETIQALAALL